MKYYQIKHFLKKILSENEFNLFYSNRIIKIQLNLFNKKENESEIRNKIIQYIENKIRFIFTYESMNYNNYISFIEFKNFNKKHDESKYKFFIHRNMINNSFMHKFNTYRHMNMINKRLLNKKHNKKHTIR